MMSDLTAFFDPASESTRLVIHFQDFYMEQEYHYPSTSMRAFVSFYVRTLKD